MYIYIIKKKLLWRQLRINNIKNDADCGSIISRYVTICKIIINIIKYNLFIIGR